MTDINTLETLILVLQEKLANAVLQNAELEALLRIERGAREPVSQSNPSE